MDASEVYSARYSPGVSVAWTRYPEKLSAPIIWGSDS
jgi:hypothetical protein